MSRKLLSLLLLCLGFPALGQSIFSWKDASGTVHYSDTPPPDGSVRTLTRTQLNAAGSSSQAMPSVIDKELALRKRAAESAEADDKARKTRAADEDRQRNCNVAKAQLQALESGQRMSRFNAAGEREILDDEQRASEIERTRALVDSNCKP